MPEDYHMHRHRGGGGGDRSGSDGEEELVLGGNNGGGGPPLPRGLPLSALQGHHVGGGHPQNHNIPSSLRRHHRGGVGGGGSSRPSPVIYQDPGSVHPENPYQQPYLSGRSAGLSDSPTSENGSADTLTDPELPFATSALPLQNGEFSYLLYERVEGYLNFL
jgi:hypothetical protein